MLNLVIGPFRLKMAREINSIEDLESKMSEISFSWEDIAPVTIHEWLNIYAKSHGTCPELLLAAMLPCTSALIGNTTMKLFDFWKEKGNLFLVGLAPSGAGKTPACNFGCVNPLITHLEPRIDQNLLVDETSSNGLFNLFVNYQKGGNKAHVPVLHIDEGYTFLHKLISTSKAVPHTSLTMERLCKLYDGDYWFTVKGNKGKRTGVQSARMSMATFTTPRRFLSEVWPKVVASRNGLADRILVLYKDGGHVDLEAMEEASQSLQESPLKGLGTVYEQIYNEHHQDVAAE